MTSEQILEDVEKAAQVSLGQKFNPHHGAGGRFASGGGGGGTAGMSMLQLAQSSHGHKGVQSSKLPDILGEGFGAGTPHGGPLM